MNGDSSTFTFSEFKEVSFIFLRIPMAATQAQNRDQSPLLPHPKARGLVEGAMRCK